jgi:hypothetical protein
MGGFGQGLDHVAEVLPLPRPNTFLVRGGRHAHVLTLPSATEKTAEEVAVEEVERAPSGPPFNEYRKLAPGTGEYLVYVPVARRERLPAQAGLFRLEGARFVPVPGGDAATLGGNGTRFYAVPSRGLVVASRTDGRLLTYRDGALAPVQDGDAAGPNLIHDLPVVGRVVVTSLRGVFELTQNLRLVPVPVPVPLSWIAAVVELPPSGAAAVIAEEGAFALGPEGGLAPIPGGEAAGSRVAKHVFLPSRNELLYTGDKGLFLLVDRRLSGPDACKRPPP